jgi:hypothetical protein
MQIGTAIYQAGRQHCRQRTWTTLPKEFQVCRFPTPADGKIQLSTPNNMIVPVTLDGVVKNDLTSTNSVPASSSPLNAGSPVNVVYVKSITAGTPLLVSTV